LQRVRRIFRAVKINNKQRSRNNNELMKLCDDLDIAAGIRIKRLKWIGHVNRMDEKRKVKQVPSTQPEGRRLVGRSKYRWLNCVNADITKVRSRTEDRGQRIERNAKGPLKRLRSALQCRAN
jgi:hypothetical protein